MRYINKHKATSLGIIAIGLFYIVSGLGLAGITLYRWRVISSFLNPSDVPMNSYVWITGGSVFFLIIAAFVCVALGVGLIRLRPLARLFLIFFLGFNFLTPLYEYAWFGSQKIFSDGMIDFLTQYLLAIFIWWFLFRKRTKEQFADQHPLKTKKAFRICIVLYTVYMLAPFVAIIGYKTYLKTEFEFPFKPLKISTIHIENQPSQQLPPDYITVGIFDLTIPVPPSLQVGRFYNQAKGCLNDTIILRSSEKRYSIIVSKEHPANHSSLKEIYGCKDSFSFLRTVHTSNWSIMPLLFKQIIHIKNGDPFVSENENHKISGLLSKPDDSRQKYILDMLVYSPKNDSSRSLTMILDAKTLDMGTVEALIQKTAYNTGTLEHNAKEIGIVGDLESLNQYDKNPTIDNALILAERLLQNEVTKRKDIECLIKTAMRNDSRNVKGLELLDSIEKETKDEMATLNEN